MADEPGLDNSPQPSAGTENPFADWFDGDDGPHGDPAGLSPAPASRAGAHPALLLAAAVPWLVVGWLLWQRPDAAPAVRPTTPTSAPGVQATQDPAREDPAPATPPAAPTSVALPTTPNHALPDGSLPGAGRADADAVGAAAVLAVRTSVSQPAVSGLQRYVDTAVAEHVRWQERFAIVRVATVVLEGDGQQWQRIRVARYAVPIGVGDDGPYALDEPWGLPEQTQEPPRLDWEEIGDAQLVETVERSLSMAGYAPVTGLSVERTGDVPGVLRTTFQTQPPGEEGGVVDHVVWLTDANQPVVLGIDA